jgi:CRISPR/Cas system Type II protein with McrA/HNH and RuvC-like nuclease domain
VKYECRCVYCGLDGKDIDVWRHLQIDHLVPITRNGPNSPENKVVACASCNAKKHGFDPSAGKLVDLESYDTVSRLIEVAKQHIELKRKAEQEDYAQMMSEIEQSKASRTS